MKTKKIISIFVLLILLCNLVALFTSCNNSDDNADYDTEITIVAHGLSATKRLRVDITNVVTNEKYQVDCPSTWGWRGRVKLDYGTYRVDNVSTKGIDSDVSCERQTFIVNTETQNIDIDVQEIDHTGTFLWFLQKNALTLTGLVACVVGVIVIKAKRNKNAGFTDAMN